MMAANLRKTLLDDEIYRIMEYTSPLTSVSFDLVIHTEELDLYPATISLYNLMDFINNKSDYITVKLRMTARDFYRVLVPEANDVTATLTRKIIGSETSRTYKVIVLTSLFEPNQLTTLSDLELDNEIIDIDIQLLDIYYYIFRNITTSGTFHNQDLSSVLNTMLSREQTLSSKFFISEVNNKRVYDNIVITSGTRLLDLADYLHDRYGLYTSAPNTYIQGIKENNYTYIYGLLGHNSLTDYTISFIDPGGNLLSEETTNRFIKEVDNYVVLAKEVASSDVKEQHSIQHGNAMVIPVEETMYNRPTSTSGNTSSITPTNLSEYGQDSELTDKMLAVKHTSSNPHKARGELLMRKGSYYTVTAVYTDMFLFRPNVRVSITTLEKDEVVVLHGVIHLVEIQHSNVAKVTTAVLKVFIDNVES